MATAEIDQPEFLVALLRSHVRETLTTELRAVADAVIEEVLDHAIGGLETTIRAQTDMMNRRLLVDVIVRRSRV